ncbi:MAG: catalase [Proteobacteria bacterium]|nr:catalase [Pseudomonadota bacterium]MBU1056902.1 catalase [Pseudomonadota bacterium]
MAAIIQSDNTQIYTDIKSLQPSSDEQKSVSRQGSVPAPFQNNDTLTLSAEGQRLSRNSSTTPVTEEKEKQVSIEEKGTDQQALTEEQTSQLAELKKRDIEVKAHEQAHLAAAGQYATGGASFSYQTGPDGKRYASGGEVPIDTGKESNPEATIQKMRTVKRAALAPANPSSADRSIAAQVTAKESQAMKEILSNVEEKSSPEPLSQTDQESSGLKTEPSDDPPAKGQDQGPPAAALSEITRRAMKSAYQTMADMAA